MFCSGFGLAASYYGLPDIGFVTWRDMEEFAAKVRHALPESHLLVDIDDGFGDHVIASRVVRNLEADGVSAVMMEDQRLPRRCGHFPGKEVLPLPEYLQKLTAVLAGRESLFVIARTDETDASQAVRRAVAYAEAGADAVMVEAIHDLETVSQVAAEVDCPIMVNPLHGGESPNWSLQEMSEAGVAIVIYSTPCLFAAQRAITNYLDRLGREQRLPAVGSATMQECVDVLEAEG